MNFGIPNHLHSDGGPQFTAKPFQDFCQELSICAHVSSPHFPQSNGHAEAAVKALKALVKRYWDNGMLNQEAFDYASLEWRNVPRKDGLSPAQWLFGRSIRTRTPSHPTSYQALNSSDLEQGEERRKAHHYKIKTNYDRSARLLPPLSIGTSVWIQNATSGLWDNIGVIEGIRETDRSNLVCIPEGRTYIRNRRFLRLVGQLNQPIVVENDSSTCSYQPRRSPRFKKSSDNTFLDF